MKIIVICDQVDCMYNKGDNTGHDYSYETRCTFKHPVFYTAASNRQCVSKSIKHIKHIVDPCANCTEQDITACANCCHKNFHKRKNSKDE